MSRTRLLLAAATLLGLPAASVVAQQPAGDAQRLAQEILDEGAALFSTWDAAAMAATYTDDGVAVLIATNDQGEITVETREGRSQVQALYADVFKDPGQKTTARNTVEFARRVGPSLLIINGYFQPNVNAQGKYPFVQVRQKEGDAWKIRRIQVFLTPID